MARRASNSLSDSERDKLLDRYDRDQERLRDYRAGKGGFEDIGSATADRQAQALEDSYGGSGHGSHDWYDTLRRERDEDRGNGKDYSAPQDYSGTKDYSDPSSSHPGPDFEARGYTPVNNRSTETANNLSALENNAPGANKNKQRDISSLENAKGDLPYKHNLASNTAKKGKLGNKKFLIGGGVSFLAIGALVFAIGILVSGAAQFLQLDKLFENKLGFISSSVIATRNLYNTATMAKNAASNALRGTNANSIVNGKKVGMIVDRFANKQLDELAKRGVKFNSNGTKLTIAADANVPDGLLDGIGNKFQKIGDTGELIVDLTDMPSSSRNTLVRSLDNVSNSKVIGWLRARSVSAKLAQTAVSTSWWQPIKKLTLLLKKGGSSVNEKLTAFLLKKVFQKSIDDLIARTALQTFKDTATERVPPSAREAVADALKQAPDVDAAKQVLREVLGDGASDVIANADDAVERAVARYGENAAKQVVKGAVKAAGGGIVKRLPKAAVKAMETVAEIGGQVLSHVKASAFGITSIIVQLMEFACMIAAVDDELGASNYLNIVIPAIEQASVTQAISSQIQDGFQEYESSKDPQSENCSDGSETVVDGETLVCTTLSPMDYLGLKSKQILFNNEITQVCEEYDDDGNVTSQEACGKTTSSVWDSAPIKALSDRQYSDDDVNNTVPAALPAATKGKNHQLDHLGVGSLGSFISGAIDVANTVADNPFGAIACGILNNVVGGIIAGLAAGVLDGIIAAAGTASGAVTVGAGTAATIAMTVAAISLSVAIAGATAYLQDFITSDPLAVDETTLPSQYGSIFSFGKIWQQNELMIQLGGHLLSSQQTAELWGIQQRYLAQEWANKPFLEKLFDPTDYRSTANVIARAANFDVSSQNIWTQLGNVAKVFGSAPKIFGAAIKGFGGSAYAADAQPFGGYNFGPIYGFSASEQAKMADENYNILDNTNKVGDIVQSDNSYLEKAKSCNAVDIDASTLEARQVSNFDGTTWNYIDNTQLEGETAGKNYKDCDTIDDNTLRVSFSMLDYGLAVSEDCYVNNGWNGGESASSCAESGFGTGSSSSSGEDNGNYDSDDTGDSGDNYNYPATNGQCPAGDSRITNYGTQEGRTGANQPKSINTCGILNAPTKFKNSQNKYVIEVNANIAKQTADMFDAAKASGINMNSTAISIGFRNYEMQKCIYDYYVTGKRGCSMFVTRPTAAANPDTKASNHQMGFAIDIPCSNSANSKLNSWLNSNMKKYGFNRPMPSSDCGHIENKGQ